MDLIMDLIILIKTGTSLRNRRGPSKNWPKRSKKKVSPEESCYEDRTKVGFLYKANQLTILSSIANECL